MSLALVDPIEVLARTLKGEGESGGVPLRFRPALGADSYYVVWSDPPDWVSRAVFVRQEGDLRFYKVGER